MNASSKHNSQGISGLSVTRAFNELKKGDHSAAALLWQFLQKRLLDLCKSVTRNNQHPVYDEQAVAMDAFYSLCSGFESNRYDEIANRDELWSLLAVITVNTARKKAAHEMRIKRGREFHRVEDSEKALAQCTDCQPTPEFTLLMQDECSRLLRLLGKEELQMVAMHKVEGFTNEEIASSLGCTRRAVQRRLALIRGIWSEEIS